MDTEAEILQCFFEAMMSARLFSSVPKMRNLIHEYATNKDFRAVKEALRNALVSGNVNIHREYSYAGKCESVDAFRKAIRRRCLPSNTIGEALLLRLLERYSGISAVIIGEKPVINKGDPILSGSDRLHVKRMEGSRKYMILVRSEGDKNNLSRVSYSLFKNEKGKSVFLSRKRGESDPFGL